MNTSQSSGHFNAAMPREYKLQAMRATTGIHCIKTNGNRSSSSTSKLVTWDTPATAFDREAATANLWPRVWNPLDDTLAYSSSVHNLSFGCSVWAGGSAHLTEPVLPLGNGRIIRSRCAPREGASSGSGACVLNPTISNKRA